MNDLYEKLANLYFLSIFTTSEIQVKIENLKKLLENKETSSPILRKSLEEDIEFLNCLIGDDNAK